ncbi:MAG: helix-turn-helix transcriptional regulator [Odoribacter sp.]|nr:helix-turn-helix transcriptional regulator [Odoribacter sp.]
MNLLQPDNNLEKYRGIAKCPVRNVISRFSGKWSMLILCMFADNGPTRFSVIGKTIPDISPKVLAETLKSLEADGLISRKLYAEVPPRVEYSLTELGQSLIPVLNRLIGWAISNFEKFGCK